ncbi:hypothetical protein BDV59DRAFT_104413 [Aspergillus ambiguus]|uniref:uncharacterized protein n=1 Tax=Aspergillus ambiguus TaxID=176160 RepID=UPI003CCE4561
MNPLRWLVSRFKQDQPSIYALDHAVLNLRLPPSMWMNMGYWEDASDLPTACTALLDQVLITAGLLDPTGLPTTRAPPRRLHLLDVGIGCGDQTLHLLQCHRPDAHRGPLFDTYTGITDLPAQADWARQRLPLTRRQTRVQIHAANAADPAVWPAELKNALLPRASSDSPAAEGAETWLLALDSLYHFRPSRRPLLRYARASLHASLMAFDLLRADHLSPWQSLLLRLVCWVSGTPFANLLTAAEYEALLVEVGYALPRVEMRDVSPHVFAGLAAFIRRQDAALRPFGLGVGRFRVAARLFDWWARTGIVRGVVVVARV